MGFQFCYKLEYNLGSVFEQTNVNFSFGLHSKAKGVPCKFVDARKVLTEFTAYVARNYLP